MNIVKEVDILKLGIYFGVPDVKYDFNTLLKIYEVL